VTPRRASSAVFVVAAVGLVGWVWWMGRGFGLFSDEWNVAILANKGKLLEPFNGHLTLVPQLVYLGLSRAVGLEHYGAYRAAGLLSYVVLAAFAGWHAARRSTPWVGALIGISMLWSSAGELTVLFPLLINFTIPAIAGLGIWLLLEQNETRDLWGAVLLAVALASSAVGVVVAVVIGAELLLRRVGWRRLIPYAVPVVLWAAWWAGFHTTSPRSGGLGALVSFAWNEGFGSFAALTGNWTPGGVVVLVAFVVVFAFAIFVWRSFDVRASSALIGFLAFVVLTSLGRQGLGVGNSHLPTIPPTTNRYLFINDLFLLSALASVIGPPLRGRRKRAVDTGAVALIAAGVAALLVVNGVALSRRVRTSRHDHLVYARSARTYLLGAELAGSHADRARVLPINFIRVTTGDYLGLVARVGSPLAHHVDTSTLGTEQDRATVDAWLFHDLEITGRSAFASPAGCVAGTTAAAGETFAVVAGSSPVEVRLRRLANTGGTMVGTVAPHAVVTISLPHDPRPGPSWRIDTSANAIVEVCP
jgi:hypothetical protein